MKAVADANPRVREMASTSFDTRQDRLEEQLLAGLTQKLLRPDMLEYAVQRFAENLQNRLKEIEEEQRSLASGITALQGRRAELKAKATNLAEAIAAMGHSPTLLAQLSAVERDIEGIDQKIAQTNTPKDLSLSMQRLGEFVTEKTLDLQSVLKGDVAVARRALANHIEKLTLTPKKTPEGVVLEVSGDVDLFAGDERVMQLVARDGIEPPTPAFSGLRSTS
jgi:chromosome segregation ATPase